MKIRTIIHNKVYTALLAAALALLVMAPVYAELPVPCGACAGGVWVSNGSASLNSINNGIQVQQQTPQAILNWESFNVGAGKRVDFKQPSSTAVALNRIFQGDPSRIFGSVTANGQVYLINQNGIVFGEGARVNTQSLIASTLDVPDDVFSDIGLINAVNQNRAALEGAGTNERIEVAKGAEIRVAADGRAILAAPEVINEGTIVANEGQAILVGATDKVYLEASDNADLRGLLVEVETGGSVTNLGEVIADGGNATLLGFAVNQNGRVRANSTVSKNGTIRLLARDDAVTEAGVTASVRTAVARRSGQLTIGAGSETLIAADTSDGATASDAQSLVATKNENLADDILIESGARVVAEVG
ncbi:MAG: filamentous hemagglutinin N-terminal domain-containing protein, partial [Pseudomonadota bacterium]